MFDNQARLNQVAAYIRGLRQKQEQMQSEIVKVAQGLTAMHKSAASAAAQLNRIAENSEGFKPLEWEALARQADRVIPFWYTVDIAFVQGSTVLGNGTISVLSSGYFLATRISVTTRPTAGANNGEYKPVSSGNPTIAGAELQAGANVADKIDFTFRYQTTSTNQYRQQGQLPGDLFYRIDGDLILPIPDILKPAEDIVCEVTPLQPMDNNCVVSVTFWGMQALNVLEAQQ